MSRIRLRKFRRKVRVNHKSKRKYIPIKVPEIMDLNENFESTVSFFLKLRDSPWIALCVLPLKIKSLKSGFIYIKNLAKPV